MRAREALRQCLPDALQDNTFAVALKDDATVTKWLSSLLFNISQEGVGQGGGGQGGPVLTHDLS
mgnify:FL=1